MDGARTGRLQSLARLSLSRRLTVLTSVEKTASNQRVPSERETPIFYRFALFLTYQDSWYQSTLLREAPDIEDYDIDLQDEFHREMRGTRPSLVPANEEDVGQLFEKLFWVCNDLPVLTLNFRRLTVRASNY